MKYFLSTVIVFIALIIGVGLFVVGSPQKERERRFDTLRIQHLQNLQFELYNYWNTNKKLPDSLAVFDGTLTNGWSGFVPPTDPETGTAYEYQKKDEDTFALCGVFNMKSDSTEQSMYAPYPVAKPGMPDSWAHDVGRVCFERTFDKVNWVTPSDVLPVKN